MTGYVSLLPSRGFWGEEVTVRTLADATLRRSPVQAVFRRRTANRLAVLAYHGVDDPAQLARQLDLLVARARPVDLDTVVGALHERNPLPERAVLVTFDDGHRSVLEHGLPLLRERGVPAVAFVLPGVLGTDRPFWWHEAGSLVGAGAHVDGWQGDASSVVRRLKQVPDSERRAVLAALRRSAPGPGVYQPQLREDELRLLEAGGVEIGNHTWDHPCLDRCADEVVRAEVRDGHAALTDALGHAPRAFAYPNGNWDPRAEHELRDLGYRVAFLFDHRLATVPAAEPLRLSRLRVNSDTPLDRFDTVITGLHPALHHARGRG